MSRDIAIQLEPLNDFQNSTFGTDKTNEDPSLYKEIASLKADNWSLKLSLSDSVQCSNNLQIVLTNTIQEKYELVEEIHNLHKLNKKLQSEREKFLIERRNLLNQIYELKDELDRKHDSVAGLYNQSGQLKESLYRAQETIHRMGNMFLKLRSTKQKCNRNVPLTQ
ncbi:uncharacterized protein LOC119067894 [Bradysia coprophila]|uniref:uncharacterized protein LOC119067894 n=1 Tax=Bradysia coprophila TaxID=38358 RepID=UPI00187DC9BA|nr:uncharacterized protein LOC119067894 [Bradysia coprophila]